MGEDFWDDARMESQVGFELYDVRERYDVFDDPGLATALGKGEGLAHTRALLAKDIELFWRWEMAPTATGPRWPWMKVELQRRYGFRDYGSFPHVLRQLATWDATARAEYWSILRGGRYMWLEKPGGSHTLTLGFDFATVPHWTEELESNRCRISVCVGDALVDLVGEGVDATHMEYNGSGVPRSQRVRAWFP